MRHVPVNVGPFSGYHEESLTQWSKCETDSPFSVVLSLPGACGTRQTERRLFSGIRSRNCAPISKPILRLECRGTTMAREEKNGA